ncbi:MAG: hypothetical protein ABIS01_00155, partial [Ferruginibacter sp.]
QHQNPLVAAKVSCGNGYDGRQFSLIAVSDPGVLAWAVKPAEEGIDNGIILRLWNFADSNKPVSISSGINFKKGFSTTHIETGDKPLAITGGKLLTTMGHNRMQTFRLF